MDKEKIAAKAVRLVACPLCGAESGYMLNEGTTFRWRGLACTACGQELDEIRLAADPDKAWNRVGAHAAGLRAEIERLRAALVEIARPEMRNAESVRLIAEMALGA